MCFHGQILYVVEGGGGFWMVVVVRRKLVKHYRHRACWCNVGMRCVVRDRNWVEWVNRGAVDGVRMAVEMFDAERLCSDEWDSSALLYALLLLVFDLESDFMVRKNKTIHNKTGSQRNHRFPFYPFNPLLNPEPTVLPQKLQKVS